MATPSSTRWASYALDLTLTVWLVATGASVFLLILMTSSSSPMSSMISLSPNSTAMIDSVRGWWPSSQFDGLVDTETTLQTASSSKSLQSLTKGSIVNSQMSSHLRLSKQQMTTKTATASTEHWTDEASGIAFQHADMLPYKGHDEDHDKEKEEIEDSIRVSVRFYGESQCPFCRKFVTDAWQPIWLDTEGLRPVIDYDFIPWGNAYWPTKACNSVGSTSYNSKDRACWYQQCIASKPDSQNDVDEDDEDDCFSGNPIYQHSTKEGIVDIYESCVKADFGLDDAVQFTYCAESSIMDNAELDAEHIMRVCTVSLGNVDSDKVQECYQTRGHEIEIENAKATPSHPGVPFVTVDGTPIDNPMAVKDEICAALKSKGATKLPDSC